MAADAMTSDYRGKIDELTEQMSRRHVLAGTAALVTTGGTIVVVGEPARASVSVDELSVENAEFETEEVAPVLDVEIGYEYDVGDEPINALEFSLLVDGTEVSSDELITSRTTLEGDTTLSGSILDSDAWDQSDFRVGVGEEITREISITLEFRAVASDGAVLADDTAEDSASVIVTHPKESTITASVGGHGMIRDKN